MSSPPRPPRMEGGAAAAAAKAPPPVGRLTRQGRIDPRLTTSGSFGSFFTAPRNKSRPAQPLVKFQKHSKGQLADRQKHGLNLALWCLTERRCDCVGDCGCGSLLLCDTTQPRNRISYVVAETGAYVPGQQHYASLRPILEWMLNDKLKLSKLTNTQFYKKFVVEIAGARDATKQKVGGDNARTEAEPVRAVVGSRVDEYRYHGTTVPRY